MIGWLVGWLIGRSICRSIDLLIYVVLLFIVDRIACVFVCELFCCVLLVFVGFFGERQWLARRVQWAIVRLVQQELEDRRAEKKNRGGGGGKGGARSYFSGAWMPFPLLVGRAWLAMEVRGCTPTKAAASHSHRLHKPRFDA